MAEKKQEKPSSNIKKKKRHSRLFRFSLIAGTLLLTTIVVFLIYPYIAIWFLIVAFYNQRNLSISSIDNISNLLYNSILNNN